MAKRVSSVAASSMLLIASAVLLAVMLAGPAAAIRSTSETSVSYGKNYTGVRIDITIIAGVKLPDKKAVDAALAAVGVDTLQGCRDKYSNCVVWAQQGYCGVQYYFNGESVPFVVCRASCGNC